MATFAAQQLFLLMLMYLSYFCFASSDKRGPVISTPQQNASVKLLRPSSSDFVEVIRGGDLATDIIVQLQDFKVPESGYLVLTIGDQSIIMCPNAADNVSGCPNGAESIPDVVRFTFFNVELGPQTICVDSFDWRHARTSGECSTLVGSDRFMGRQESRDYFAANMAEFFGAEPIRRFWATLALKAARRRICPVPQKTMPHTRREHKYRLCNHQRGQPLSLRLASASSMKAPTCARCHPPRLLLRPRSIAIPPPSLPLTAPPPSPTHRTSAPAPWSGSVRCAPAARSSRRRRCARAPNGGPGSRRVGGGGTVDGRDSQRGVSIAPLSFSLCSSLLLFPPPTFLPFILPLPPPPLSLAAPSLTPQPF